MRILYRCDASDSMGQGHVMRCLTLADACQQMGARSTFICRDHPGNLSKMIQASGHHCVTLPRQTLNSSQTYANWLGASESDDAAACDRQLGSKRYDWLVTDHYGISATWHKLMRAHTDKILAVDDLANRDHDCDLLLDPTFGRKTSAYEKRVPLPSKLLCGSDYALLRPQYSQLRLQCKSSGEPASAPALMVYLGGARQAQTLFAVLEQIAKVSLCRGWHVHIVCGAVADSVKDGAPDYPFQVTVYDFVMDMPGLLSRMDFAVGAGGGSVWERAALGIPSLILVTAENQQTIADTLSRNRTAIVCREINQISQLLPELLQKAWKLRLLSRALCDARGCYRVVSYLQGKSPASEVALRPMLAEDETYLFRLQSQTDSRRYFRNGEIPSPKQHQRWFHHSLDAADSAHFIIRLNANNCGYLRFDQQGTAAEVSILVDEQYRGHGIAGQALARAVDISCGMPLLASVHRDNQHSVRLFTRAGFTQHDQSDCFLEMRR